MSIEQKILESTNVEDSTSAAIVGNTVLPAGAVYLEQTLIRRTKRKELKSDGKFRSKTN